VWEVRAFVGIGMNHADGTEAMSEIICQSSSDIQFCRYTVGATAYTQPTVKLQSVCTKNSTVASGSANHRPDKDATLFARCRQIDPQSTHGLTAVTDCTLSSVAADFIIASADVNNVGSLTQIQVLSDRKAIAVYSTEPPIAPNTNSERAALFLASPHGARRLAMPLSLCCGGSRCCLAFQPVATGNVD